MSEKELVIESIENYSFYTITQRLLLKSLYQLVTNNYIYASVSEISKITKISRASVYRMLSIFKKDGIILCPAKENLKINQIILVPEKIEQIKENFLKKRSLKAL